MDRFEALPLPQRVLIIFAVLAPAAGGLYFLVITDILEETAASRSRVVRAEQKAQTLKVFDDDSELNALIEEEREILEQLEANKALLPDEEKIPALITAIKRQADERGLKILKFRKGERDLDDYVAVIPVDMEVQGSYPVLISFLEALAQPGMRMMTVSDLTLDHLAVKKFMDDEGGYQKVLGRQKTRKMTTSGAVEQGEGNPSDIVIAKLDAYQAALNRYQIRAEFTVNAYSYTGQVLTPEQRQKRLKSGRNRRRR